MALTLRGDCMDGRRWLDAVREPAWKLDAAARHVKMSNSSSQLVDPEIATVDCSRVAQSSPLMKMFCADTSP